MVRFFYKEKESVNAKVLKVCLQYNWIFFFPINVDFKIKVFNFFFFFFKDVKFPLMLDVYELCTTELQEKMLPIRSKFKDIEDKKLEKQQKKVRRILGFSFLLNLVVEKHPVLICIAITALFVSACFLL